MQRFTRFLVAASAAVFLLPLVSPEAAQATVDDQRQLVQQIVDELERLHERADILAEDYNVAVQTKNELDEEVEETKQRVAAKEAELAELRGDLSNVAVQAFTGAGTDVLGPLFSNAEEYSDELRGEQFRGAALDTGAVTTDDLDALVDSLEDERTSLESKLAEQEQLAIEIQNTQAEVEELTGQYIERRAEEEARLGELIALEEQRRAEEAWAAAQAELAAQESAAATTGGTTSNGGGGASTGTAAADSGDTSNNESNNAGGESASAPQAAAPVSNVPAPSGLAGTAIAAAQSQLGVSYVYATSLPGVSFDCSGLTHYAWGQAGVYLPRNSRAQAAAIPNVPAASAQPGDLIFYYSPISHVGIYIGGGQLIHAPNSRSVVKIASVSWDKVTAVGRPG